jgi:anti-sigma B factor antagonist
LKGLLAFDSKKNRFNMKFAVNKEERYVKIEPAEENLTSMFAPQLKTEFVLMNNEGFRNIICDLISVKYVDSSGLSSFLVGDRICNEKGGKFVLCNISDSLKQLLALSQLDSILNVTPTLAEAVDLVLLHELERDLRD